MHITRECVTKVVLANSSGFIKVTSCRDTDMHGERGHTLQKQFGYLKQSVEITKLLNLGVEE